MKHKPVSPNGLKMRAEEDWYGWEFDPDCYCLRCYPVHLYLGHLVPIKGNNMNDILNEAGELVSQTTAEEATLAPLTEAETEVVGHVQEGEGSVATEADLIPAA